MKVDHPSYRRNFCGCENKALRKKKKKRTVDISSNLCGITGVVWNP